MIPEQELIETLREIDCLIEKKKIAQAQAIIRYYILKLQGVV